MPEQSPLTPPVTIADLNASQHPERQLVSYVQLVTEQCQQGESQQPSQSAEEAIERFTAVVDTVGDRALAGVTMAVQFNIVKLGGEPLGPIGTFDANIREAAGVLSDDIFRRSSDDQGPVGSLVHRGRNGSAVTEIVKIYEGADGEVAMLRTERADLATYKSRSASWVEGRTVDPEYTASHLEDDIAQLLQQSAANKEGDAEPPELAAIAERIAQVSPDVVMHRVTDVLKADRDMPSRQDLRKMALLLDSYEDILVRPPSEQRRILIAQLLVLRNDNRYGLDHIIASNDSPDIRGLIRNVQDVFVRTLFGRHEATRYPSESVASAIQTVRLSASHAILANRTALVEASGLRTRLEPTNPDVSYVEQTEKSLTAEDVRRWYTS